MSAKRGRVRGRKVNNTGRSTGEESFFKLPAGLAQSAVIRTLPGQSMKIWIELHARHNGYNNGRVGLSLGECATLLGIGKTTAKRALAELQTRGLVKLTTLGTYRGRLSSEWELTDQPTEHLGPSREYKDWRPEPKKTRPPKLRTRPTKTSRKNSRWYRGET